MQGFIIHIEGENIMETNQETTNMGMVLNRTFGESEIKIIKGKSGELLFELYSLGFAVGYGRMKKVKGKNYPEIQKTRIHTIMKNGSITGLPRGVETYLTEEGVNSFLMESNTAKAKEFKLWLSEEVIPEINHNGVYIDAEASQEQIKFNFNSLYATFGICSLELLMDLYLDCIEFYKSNNITIRKGNNAKGRKGQVWNNTDTRKMVLDRLEDCLTTRKSDLLMKGSIGFAHEINNVILKIKEDRNRLDNRSNGGHKAALVKENKMLKSKLSEANPITETLQS